MSRQGLPALIGLRIQGEKVVSYLLDPTHPKGGSKAKYLMRLGFTAEGPKALADALAIQYQNAPDARVVLDEVGSRRIICEGPIVGLNGREAWIRSVWLVEPDLHGRLLTVVPRPKRGAASL
ncbi:hypothetical protein MKK63_10985 [Methylobacterium sp. J-088]|uniref:DUF6883 domain-containing protein n=1 Tax=Methylobacterium sp. J-088 TaxID=2836664 RepID=UPI001FBAA46B|nr:DUF6883 domain-containing protein [Methylobacterium sp. J-088]MCJ2063234.1 hypothetical protein [Methylobacterium sp. J-088]